MDEPFTHFRFNLDKVEKEKRSQHYNKLLFK